MSKHIIDQFSKINVVLSETILCTIGPLAKNLYLEWLAKRPKKCKDHAFRPLNLNGQEICQSGSPEWLLHSDQRKKKISVEGELFQVHPPTQKLEAEYDSEEIALAIQPYYCSLYAIQMVLDFFSFFSFNYASVSLGFFKNYKEYEDM